MRDNFNRHPACKDDEMEGNLKQNNVAKMKSTELEKKHVLAISGMSGFLTGTIGNRRPAKYFNISLRRCARGVEEYLQKATASFDINILCCVTTT
jgi:hypothetical protein